MNDPLTELAATCAEPFIMRVWGNSTDHAGVECERQKLVSAILTALQSATRAKDERIKELEDAVTSLHSQWADDSRALRTIVEAKDKEIVELRVALMAAVSAILDHPQSFSWTTQGFGMIRTYLDSGKRWRLNIWDDRLAIPNVSLIHDHPWSFRSFIIAGRLTNQRYRIVAGDPTHQFHSILTGEGGGPVETPSFCRLEKTVTEVFGPGETYAQSLDQIHETSYLRGTITLNDRTPPTKTHTARVFWPVGQPWVDAMPRTATNDEVINAIDAARKSPRNSPCKTPVKGSI